jgi:hypothetical protein
LPRLCENENRESTVVLDNTPLPPGVFVNSENRAVMVIPLEYIPCVPVGSPAVKLVMYGPPRLPKLPDNSGETDVDARDVLSIFFRFADRFTVVISPPIVGGVEPVESIIVTTNVEGVVH